MSRRMVAVGLAASLVSMLVGVSVLIVARVAHNSGRVGTASYGNLRFFGKYCGSLSDPDHWEYNRVEMIVGDDHPHAAHEVFICYHDAKFEEKDFLAILQQPEWKEIPIGEASADIRIGAKVAKAWRNPSGSLLTIREDETMAFYMGPGDFVSLQIDKRLIRFPVVKREIDNLLGRPDRFESRATWR